MGHFIERLSKQLIANFSNRYEIYAPNIFPNSEQLNMNLVDKLTLVALCNLGLMTVQNDLVRSDLMILKRYLKCSRKWKSVYLEFKSLPY